jgi:spore coat polysaccharide biosynthesis protein SpsF
MRVITIIQARLGSTRLPGKVLLDLAGEPMLARVVARAARSRTVQQVVVATTDRPTDDALADFCRRRDIACFRGSENDVLDRYYQAAAAHRAEAVVRVTSDCPLIDPALMDRAVGEFLARQPEIEYVSNSYPRDTFPRGLDMEIIRRDVLERAWEEDGNPAWREHVSPYIYRHPERFRIHGVMNDVDLSAMRWTVDTPEDLELVRRIFAHFGHDRFAWTEVLALMAEHPEWAEGNRHVVQKSIPLAPREVG